MFGWCADVQQSIKSSERIAYVGNNTLDVYRNALEPSYNANHVFVHLEETYNEYDDNNITKSQKTLNRIPNAIETHTRQDIRVFVGLKPPPLGQMDYDTEEEEIDELCKSNVLRLYNRIKMLFDYRVETIVVVSEFTIKNPSEYVEVDDPPLQPVTDTCDCWEWDGKDSNPIEYPVDVTRCLFPEKYSQVKEQI